MSTDKWCTIESDPGVFTELIQTFGVKGVQVEELITMEETEFNQLNKNIYIKEKKICYEPELFFANQVIMNACATQAILAILLNVQRTLVSLGTPLSDFKSFCEGLDPKVFSTKSCSSESYYLSGRGMALENSELIRNAHNSFGKTETLFIEQERKATDKNDVYHFISYVPFKGKLYELDGLQSGPVNLGECTEENWIELAKTEIQTRMTESATNEITFNLLALLGDKQIAAEHEIAVQKAVKKEICVRLQLGYMKDFEPDPLYAEQIAEQVTLLPAEKEGLEARYTDIDGLITKNELIFVTEQEKRKKWKAENIRRKHNYLPFLFEMLKLLSQKGRLAPLVKDANQKWDEKIEKKRKEKEEKKKKEEEEKKRAA